MSKLRTSLVLGAALSFATIAAYAVDEAQPAAQDKTAPVATATATKSAPVAKVNKAAHKMVKKATMVEVDMDAINKATQQDLQKAVSAKVAKHIIDVRTKVGGQFADQKQFCKEAKIGKRQLEKLAKVFPKANEAEVSK